MIRLDKFLCDANVGTRSEVKELLKRGRVTVDGSVVQKADFKVAEGKNVVCLDKKPLTFAQKVYYLLNKPAGVVSASRDRREKTALDLLKGAPGRDLFLVGRLDKDTEGLLLVTNDGDLAHRLLSPGRHVDKTYRVLTQKEVTQECLKRLEAGVDIGDEKPTRPAVAKKLADTPNGLLLTIQEGRFHQVKRMLLAVGNEVVGLTRISMGPVVLEDSLPIGQWRPLTEKEKEDLGVLH